MKPIISAQIRVRHPEFFEIGEDSIVDDFSYFSAKVKVGRGSHIASGCTVGGGNAFQFEMGDYCSVSSGVKIWCVSDDFVNDIVTIIPSGAGKIKSNVKGGNVVMGNYTAIGSNTVVMPNNHIPEGTVIGAMSFVPENFDFKPWSVYAGIPLRYVGPRNKEQVLTQAAKLDAFYKSER